ncbi:hypothetical protein FFLO_04726 [Filobasidium floriforme]|uniref:Protein ROT1 n=1 Tax=Filobasidium floriforme TaxID=5210 RepID=A0A8K0NPL9_9TREE|nr:hypothetical protein FFLO_04726 [Filobasidium floriforme]
MFSPINTILTASLLTLTTLTSVVKAQGDLSALNNITSLTGTWSSGSGGVQTGGSFCNPQNFSFTYPTTTGISYSFTDDGHFEEAQYRYNANPADPRCITAFILWQHGRYQLNNNGSLSLFPFSADGRIQVQDPCAAVTNLITYYDQMVMFQDWGIQVDSIKASYALQLNAFDGKPLPPLYLVANPPNMLPTVILTGVNATGQASKRSLDEDEEVEKLQKRSGAISERGVGSVQAVAGLIGAGLLMMTGLMGL